MVLQFFYRDALTVLCETFEKHQSFAMFHRDALTVLCEVFEEHHDLALEELRLDGRGKLSQVECCGAADHRHVVMAQLAVQGP